jgi:Tfp pilus assembly protein PilF
VADVAYLYSPVRRTPGRKSMGTGGLAVCPWLEDDPAVQAQLGELYASDGRSDRAIESFEKVVALAPHWPQGFFTLARHYEVEEPHADALWTYSRGLALEPNNA